MTEPRSYIDTNAVAPESTFRKELAALINRHSLEGLSGTPDYILAEFLASVLESFNGAMQLRARWYSHRQASVAPKETEPA